MAMPHGAMCISPGPQFLGYHLHPYYPRVTFDFPRRMDDDRPVSSIPDRRNGQRYQWAGCAGISIRDRMNF
jgi:hypothetical protein